MTTRAAAKRAAELAAATEKAAQSLSSPPTTPNAGSGDAKDSSMPLMDAIPTTVLQSSLSTQTPTPDDTKSTTKRKRATKSKKAEVTMKGDWDVLPHGMGKKGDLEDGFDNDAAKQTSAPPAKRARCGKAVKNEVRDATMTDVKKETIGDAEFLKDIALKLGKPADAEDADFEGESPKKRKSTKTPSPRKKKTDGSGTIEKTPRKKKHPYGLTPGFSPFPGHAKPTQEDCEEVYKLLSELHGEVKAPDVIPPPSMEVTGCGEVPDLLDALLRTLLSAATTSKISNMALQGLKNTFGLRESGIGKGSINWEAVHEADLNKVIESIKSGGLAKAKGTNIKKILDAVYDHNITRFNALTEELKTGEPARVPGAKHETREQKKNELARFKDNMLTLDYLFELTTDEVMEELTKLPGIGVKTSSCVILFCMKRPSFAVDTHVWRHCKWLDWVPEKATRDQTFSHCEVKIPDELKYALHQLFIQHGKKCPRCRANTGPGSEEWESAECPIEHLVKRTGKMKVKATGASPTKKSKGKKVESEDDDESEESASAEMDDLDEDDE